mmetsp:Transcript_22064/g.33535  ORF Transcript_22064/g.33535 Transcript_22064/m.33535 type:complete len:295 (+) Transcript_22064:95-979(+)
MKGELSPLVGLGNNMGSSTFSSSERTQGFGFGLLLKILIPIFLLISYLETCFVVPPGTIGIVITLGHVQSFSNGVHTKIPFVSELVYLTAKTQKLEEENEIPTKEGLNVRLDTAVLFRLDSSKAADIYKQVGEDYINLILAPEASSAIRGLTSESEAKALYSNGRNIMQETLRKQLKEKLEPRGIIVEDVLLKDIKLPALLSKAIEMKAQAEQDAARMEFVLQKERQEAERKAIEAQGIADFQKIVSEGISPQLLQWKGIEATEKFADSPNSKIIMIGNDSGGLPVLFSGDTQK